MNATTSVTLNFVRVCAALVVFVGHLAGARFTAGFLWQFSAFMDAAVIIFFVLSGYVIGYVSDTYETTLRVYAINRIARVFSVALPALLLTAVLDAVGRNLRPDLYNAAWGFSDKHIWLQYAEGLTFTTRVWWNEASVGSMLPYWSLTYEAWYYAIFAACWYLRGTQRLIITALLCMVAGPRILSLAPIWGLGFAAYHINKHFKLPKWISWSFLAVACLALIGSAYGALRLRYALSADYGPRYLEAAVCFLLLLAIRNYKLRDDTLKRVRRPIEWLAGLTFSLYLIHLPVAQFLISISPYAASSLAARLLIMPGTFIAVMVFASLTERRKKLWRNAISRLINPGKHLAVGS